MKAPEGVRPQVGVACPTTSGDLGAALAKGFPDLIAQKRGRASYGGVVYQLANGKTARLDDAASASAASPPEFAVVADAGTGDDGQCRIYAYAPLSREAVESYATRTTEAFVVPSKGHAVRARVVDRAGRGHDEGALM